jgi:hypothetical protein
LMAMIIDRHPVLGAVLVPCGGLVRLNLPEVLPSKPGWDVELCPHGRNAYGSFYAHKARSH